MKAVVALAGLSLVTLIYLSTVAVVETACAKKTLFNCGKTCHSICRTPFDTCPKEGCKKVKPCPKGGCMKAKPPKCPKGGCKKPKPPKCPKGGCKKPKTPKCPKSGCKKPKPPKCPKSGCKKPKPPKCPKSGCKKPKPPKCPKSGCKKPKTPKCPKSGCKKPKAPKCPKSGCKKPKPPKCPKSGCKKPKPPKCPKSGCKKPKTPPKKPPSKKPPPKKPPKKQGKGKRAIERSVYRNIRTDEDPEVGLTAKDPFAEKTVQSHVGCGCRNNYASQYISTTASLEAAERYNRNNRIVRINVRIARINGCKFVDLTDGGELKGLARNFAIASQEILIYDCTIPSEAITIVRG